MDKLQKEKYMQRCICIFCVFSWQMCVCWMFQPQLKGPSSDEHHEQPLPPIAESCAVDPSWAVQAQVQTDARPSAETFGCKSQENPNRLHHQLLFPPLLFPGKEGKKRKHTHRRRLQTHWPSWKISKFLSCHKPYTVGMLVKGWNWKYSIYFTLSIHFWKSPKHFYEEEVMELWHWGHWE